MKNKQTLYFLQWLSRESGFTENQILENLKSKNQGWAELNNYNSIEEFLKKYNSYQYWLGKGFCWENSLLKPDYEFWENLYDKFSIIINSENYNIEFSKYPIKNWEIIKKETKETKSVKNLKI